jgi:hypothetical protein
MRDMFVALEHDPEKWNPVFRKHHAPLKTPGTRPAKVNPVAPACALDKWAQLGCCQGGRGGNQNRKKQIGAIAGNVRLNCANRLKTPIKPMCHRAFSVVLSLCVAVGLAVAAAAPLAVPALAQNTDAKPTDQAPANGQEPAKEPQKVDEFAEAQKALGGPAGNPECVWLGRRVVSLLWRDDLDTAFRHLDLYDRFGCPSGHIQATFRCLLLHSNNIDPKAADSLNGRVNSCWINPNLQATPPAAAPAPAASVPSPTTNR